MALSDLALPAAILALVMVHNRKRREPVRELKDPFNYVRDLQPDVTIELNPQLHPKTFNDLRTRWSKWITQEWVPDQRSASAQASSWGQTSRPGSQVAPGLATRDPVGGRVAAMPFPPQTKSKD